MPAAATQPEAPDTETGAPYFSGVTGFVLYMEAALDILRALPRPCHVLDLPAGHGQMTDALRAEGFEVTPADINEGRDDYVYADMNRPLPFPDGAFDAALCLEGIEHLVNPVTLVSELIRVVRPGGTVVLSTPNILNFYSRLRFLLTGTFYQFNPATLRDLPPDAREDRFHIAPLSYHRLRYLADHFGADVAGVRTDRFKKKWLMPLFGLLHLAGLPWRRRLFFGRDAEPWRERNERMAAHLTSPAVLFGRTLILELRKRDPGDVG
ncbi:MAG: class I SAM-dependent methyltransferase [Planctomycetota bacterium]|nr:MAG: class I SAM-dependent methyltransferase [Planctomycetota bacterium]